MDASDPDFMKEVLGPLYRRRGLRVRSVRPRLMSYTPGSRATLGYQVRLHPLRDRPESEEMLVGKLNSTRPLAEMMANNWAMWRETEALFGQARPVGVVQSIGLSLQEHLDGDRLNAHVGDPGFPDLLRQVGEAAAHLHLARVPLSKTRSAEREITALRRRFGILSEIHPDRGRISGLERRMVEALGERLRVSAPVHGDFHHANVMVAGGRVHLIDFDEMGLGDPMLDVGRFMVSLSLPSRRLIGDLRLCDLARDTFLEAYARLAPVEEGQLALFEAVAYIASAASAFRLQAPTWETDMQSLVERAEARLHRLGGGPVGVPGAAAAAPVERAQWLADPTYVELLVKPDALALRGAETDGVEVQDVREKDGVVKADYRVGLRRNGRREAVKLSGLAGPFVQARALRRAIEQVSAELAGVPDGLVLPVPMGQSPGLSLLLFTPPAGARLPGMIEETPAVAEALARALAALHALDVVVPRLRPLAGYLAAAARGPGGADPAQAVNGPIPELEGEEDLRRLSLDGVRLSQFTLEDGRIGLRRADALVMAHPLVAAGRLAAELSAGYPNEAAERFRRAYGEASGTPPEALRPFERLARPAVARKEAR
jgi:streptomycin 6-kinase